jgi:hypothetical protein
MNGVLVRYSLLGYGHAGEAHELSLPSFIFIVTGALGEAKAPQHTAKFRCIGETHS